MHLFELSPNCSLTPRAALIFYLGIVAVSLSIAVSFAIVGYWPILPFAGLELLALGAALRWSMLQGQRRERIRIDEHYVRVSKTGRGDAREYEFSRAWTRVELVETNRSNWPRRLLLTSKGKALEVGRFLTEDERESLSRRLTDVIPGRQAGLTTDF